MDGKTGFIGSADYPEHDVNAAYSPLGDTVLGTVLKIDGAELYASVWRQLRFVIPLFVGMLVFALLSLRWLLAPLVLELVRTQEQIATLNTELEQRADRCPASAGQPVAS